MAAAQARKFLCGLLAAFLSLAPAPAAPLWPPANSGGFSQASKQPWPRGGAYVPGNFAYVTGDRTSAITVTSTGGLMSGTLSILVNGNTGDTGVFFNAVSIAGKQIIFDFKGVAKYINEARVSITLGNGATLGTWKWQGSNDASSWTDIGTSFALTPAASSTATMTSMAGNLLAYKYYSLTGVSGTGNVSPWISEFQFKEGS